MHFNHDRCLICSQADLSNKKRIYCTSKKMDVSEVTPSMCSAVWLVKDEDDGENVNYTDFREGLNKQPHTPAPTTIIININI